MEKHNLSSELDFIERAFVKLNDHYFNGALPTPILTIQSSRKTYGHCTTYHAWKEGDRSYYEINLGAEKLNRPLVESIATLIHEMVHLYCMVNGIHDTSKNGVYHNRKFKTEAERRDLKIDRHTNYGYTITSPTDNLIRFCEFNFGTGSEMKLHRVDLRSSPKDPSESGGEKAGDEDVGRKGAGRHTRRYLCPKCERSVRTTGEIRIKCMDCDREMEEQTRTGISLAQN
jgi:hypothetical protein